MTIASASETSSLSSPVRSGPNRMPRLSPARRDGRRHRDARAYHPLRLAALARGRGVDPMQSATAASTLSNTRAASSRRGCAGRGGIGDLAVFVVARPAFARIDEAQVVEAEIGHRARAHADVHRELWPDQMTAGPPPTGGFVLSVPAPTMPPSSARPPPRQDRGRAEPSIQGPKLQSARSRGIGSAKRPTSFRDRAEPASAHRPDWSRHPRSAASEAQLTRNPAGEGLRERVDPRAVPLHPERLVDAAGIIGGDRLERISDTTPPRGPRTIKSPAIVSSPDPAAPTPPLLGPRLSRQFARRASLRSDHPARDRGRAPGRERLAGIPPPTRRSGRRRSRATEQRPPARRGIAGPCATAAAGATANAPSAVSAARRVRTRVGIQNPL